MKSLIEYINSLMKYEQQALIEDDPNSTCAAHHRGEIAAYGRILKYIQQNMYEQVKVGMTLTEIKDK